MEFIHIIIEVQYLPPPPIELLWSCMIFFEKVFLLSIQSGEEISLLLSILEWFGVLWEGQPTKEERIEVGEFTGRGLTLLCFVPLFVEESHPSITCTLIDFDRVWGIGDGGHGGGD